MPEEHTVPDARRRERQREFTRWLWMGALAALVIARSAVFVFWPGSHFDSDQAVTGLMAKHLSELRAFPVFWYGQTYMLGVEAWLAAPLMAIGGATVTALKLPLLAMNAAIALLLFRGFTDDGLGEGNAAFAALFFVLAAPITTAHLLTANGGNVEPLFYVLLIWFLRRRPLVMGVVLGLGFLNREFTIYGAVALIVLDAHDGTLLSRAAIVKYTKAFGAAALVWIAIALLRRVSSAAGPGTSVTDLSTQIAANNLMQVIERLCFDPRAIASGVGRIFTTHWPELFGIESQPLTNFGIESAVRQGLPGAAWLLVPIMGLPVVSVVGSRVHWFSGSQVRKAGKESPVTFTVYLLVVTAVSIAGYLIGRCGVIDFYTMRYELLSILGACGLAAWYLGRETSGALRGTWLVCCAGLLGLSVIAHGRLLAEYATAPPTPAKQELIAALDARNIRYAYADYWTSYYVTFMTRERIIVASTEVVKVRTHNNEVDAHRAEAILISRRPCAGGDQLTPAFWACTP